MVKTALYRVAVCLSLILLCCLVTDVRADAGPAAAVSAPEAQGAPSILFLSTQPMMDAKYEAKLSVEGINYASGNLYDPLPYEFFRKFNLIVLDKLPHDREEFELFGQRMIQVRENLNNIWRCAREGAGVLVYANLTDGGGTLNGGWNREMNQFGVNMLEMCVRDHATAFDQFRVYGQQYYCWTEALAPHPITAGLKRIYYPSDVGRFDDCFTAPPLVCDKNWSPLVKGMPTAGVITEVDSQEIDEPEHKNDTTLAAVRQLGKGRLGVLAINPAYVHRLGYTQNGKDSEINYGVIDDVILDKGNGEVGSDTGKLVDNMYRWLSEGSVAAGFGGYKTGEPLPVLSEVQPDVAAYNPMEDFDNLNFPPSWRHRPQGVDYKGEHFWPEVSDPMITGPIQYIKALVGVHSAASDGKGSVQQYAAAAKKAGYQIVSFTENFEFLTEAKYEKLKADCEKYTTADMVLLPGIDIQDEAGNHFILAGVDSMPRKSWLNAGGKRLVQAECINLMMHAHTVIAHRSAQGPLPYERLKHFQGLSVFTYNGGKLVDDATVPYKCQVLNASNPDPISVHEVYSPREVGLASRTGYQLILPSDTPANAAGYYQAGVGLYFDSPTRFLLSEGPIVNEWTIRSKDLGPAKYNQQRFAIKLGIKSDVPLKEVTLYDGFNVVRHWTPNTAEFSAQVDFYHSNQFDLFATAVDAKGRRVMTSSMRTVAERYIFRCADRQNWLGAGAFQYTGTWLPSRLNIFMPVQGTKEASAIMPDVIGDNMAIKLNFPFCSNDMVLTEAALTDKYIDALFDTAPHKIGFDAEPSQASEPSTVYKGFMRYYNYSATTATPGASLVEFDITLKRDVSPIDPKGLFPGFYDLPNDNFAWMEGGVLKTGKLDKNGPVDVPVGGMVGNVIALSPGLQVQNGRIGLAPPAGSPSVIKAGTRFTARFLLPAGTDAVTPDTMAAMGFAGADAIPYKLKLTRGKLAGTAYAAQFSTDDHAIAGSITTTAKLPFEVPLQLGGAKPNYTETLGRDDDENMYGSVHFHSPRLEGVNPNWVAGIWRDGDELKYAGVFENTIWPRLDVSKPGRFYAGNLLLADNEALVLQLEKWTPDAIRIEAHNPTDAPIEATIHTPAEITGRKQFRAKVTIPAGTSVYLTG